MEPATEDHPLLNLLQAFFESSDPNNYGPLLVQRPPAGAAPKHVFQTLGLVDNYTPVPNIAAFALSMECSRSSPRLYDISGLGLTPQRWGRHRCRAMRRADRRRRCCGSTWRLRRKTGTSWSSICGRRGTTGRAFWPRTR